MLLRAARFAPARRAACAAPAAHARSARLPPAAAAPPAWAQRAAFAASPLAPRAACSAARRGRGLCTAAPAAAASGAGPALNAKQKKEMRAHAQRLGQARKLIIVQVGKNGLTPGVAQSLDEALTAHEIVKVKVGDASEDDSEDVAEALAAQLRASVAGRVGGTVLFVRLRPRGEGAPSVIRPLLDALA